MKISSGLDISFSFSFDKTLFVKLIPFIPDLKFLFLPFSSLNRPPPPMYRRVPPPAHMMTLDRRIPGGTGVRGLQHQLLPNGCDVTLNRRHFNNAPTDLRNTNHCSSMQRRRLPDDLWLV